jgi:hypothetical protein
VTTTLFLIFFVLKLAGLVTWSWWFVFSPLLIAFTLAVLVQVLTELKK